MIAALSNSGDQLLWCANIGRFLAVRELRARPGGGVVAAGASQYVEEELALPPTYRNRANLTDVWLVRVSAAGSVDAATYLGGGSDETLHGLAVGPDDSIYLAGTTTSSDFPITSGALQTSFGRGNSGSGFVTRLNAAVSGPVYSTYFGGNEGRTLITGLAVDRHGAAYVAGVTLAAEFMLTTGHSFGQCLNADETCSKLFLAKLLPGGSLAYANRINARQFQSLIPFQDPPVLVNVTPGNEPVIAFQATSLGLPVVAAVQPRFGDGPLLESVDAGRTFRSTAAGFTCNAPLGLTFAPSNPALVYAFGPDFCRSSDGGRTWRTTQLGGVQSIAVSPADALTILGASPGGMAKSTDGGMTWQPSGAGLPNGGATAVAFDPTNASVAYASDETSGGGIYRSTDGGASWAVLPSSVTGRLQLVRVAKTTPTTIFARNWKSTDGGATWQSASPPVQSQRGAPFAEDPTNPAIVYAGGDHPNWGVCRSTDGGTTYPSCSSSGLIGLRGNMAAALAVDPTTPSRLYGSFLGGVSYSVDSGATWARSSLRTGTRGGHLAADPATAGRVLLAWPTSGDAAVMKFSADGARILFSSFLGGTGRDHASTIEVDPAGNLYVQGETHSPDFPLNAPRRSQLRSGSDDPYDYFLTKIAMGTTSRADFDADGRTDVSFFRPSTGEWFINNSRTGTTDTLTLGQNGDLPVSADFDGDGQADLAVFRPSTGQWRIRDSSTRQIRTVQWGGTAADVPAPADYDGDGKSDVAVWRPSNGYWYILQSATNTPRYVQWGGTSSDVPAPGDYDGDGRADIAFFRPSNGYWYLLRSTAGIQYVQWGGTTADVPAPGDYDGDGRTDVAFWRPSDNYWYIRLSSTGANRYVRWGGFPTDLPVPGDYDQDGLTDQAFFRPGDGFWYILQSRTRTARYVNLGTLGDIPIPSRR